jgi:hypothetical protein
MDLGYRRRQLLAACLAVGWLVAALVAAVVYRPGGPFDLIPAALRVLIAALAAIAILRPPPAALDRRQAVSWLGFATLAVLVPTTWTMVRQPAPPAVPVLPAPESLYPWFLAALGTGAYVGLALAGRGRGAAPAVRPLVVRGLAAGFVIAFGIAAAGGLLVAANDSVLASEAPASSSFGPTAAADPPPCAGELAAGPSARVAMELSGVVDRTEIGTAALSGTRDAADFSWVATVATTIAQGERGAARLGPDGWLQRDDGTWQPVDTAQLDPGTLDLRVVETALAPGNRAVPETVGIDVVDGARGRHCRTAVDGPTFLAAFPQTTWLIGEVDPLAWRGWIDWWVFADGELGLLDGYIDGLAADMTPPGIRVTVRVRLTAVDRDVPHPVSPPEPRG